MIEPTTHTHQPEFERNGSSRFPGINGQRLNPPVNSIQDHYQSSLHPSQLSDTLITSTFLAHPVDGQLRFRRLLLLTDTGEYRSADRVKVGDEISR